MKHIASAWQIDASGRTARVDDDAHVRDMIEHLLFTAPGERVNRPAFGSGLLQSVFAGHGEEVASTLQLLVQASLQQWLAEEVEVEAVEVEHVDATLSVTVQYRRRRNELTRVERFVREV